MLGKRRWLIVGGAPRSGTTLLFRLLKTHPELALTNEAGITADCLSRAGDSPEQVFQNWFPGVVANDHAYLGEKLPEYYELPLRQMLRKDALRVVHISRRPLNVIGSMLKRSERAAHGDDPGWSPYFGLKDAVDVWLRGWQFAMTYSDADWFLHIKYEDLTETPDVVLQEVYRHLNLPNAPADFSSVRHVAGYDLPPHANALPESIQRLDNDWGLPLDHLHREFSTVRAPAFSSLRRLKRRLLWFLSVAKRRSPGGRGS